MEEDYKNYESDKHSTNLRKKLSSVELLNVFKTEMNSSATFEFIEEEKNPCHIMFEGTEFYVYIKNLSSAYFKNPDISRAQMTEIEKLSKIKESDALFILLGYDADNRVFAAWNPYIAKQRIGTTTSPSWYSRFSWHKEAKEQGEFIIRELKNEGSVLLFPQEYISLFLKNINEFFSDTSDYVAMGSKRRSKANAAYKNLMDTKHLKEFEKKLYTSDFDHQTIQVYVSAIKCLIKTSLISKNRKIFLAYNSLSEYPDAASQFLALDEIKKLDEKKDYAFSYALPIYIKFLIDKYGKSVESTENGFEEEKEIYPCTLPNNTNVEKEKNRKEENIDYESKFIDDQGLLTCIANPALIDQLRTDLDKEYPSQFGAYATIEDFYGNRFPNMEMHHWQALFNKIDWNNPYPSLDDNSTSSHKKRSDRQKIRITLPNGEVIFEKQVVNTLLEVIKFAGVEAVCNLNITMGANSNSLLITTEKNEKYANAFKVLDNGLYVNTCSDTKTKYSQIQQINNKLNLGLIIELI